MSYLLDFAGRPTPQTEQQDSRQVENNAGGFSFQLDKWSQLERFLILGSEGNTYYCSERDVTKENITNVIECINSDGGRVVRTIIDVSDSGRAPKNDPCIYVLALCAKRGNLETRRLAFESVNKVCRIGTHIYHFANFVNTLGGWGRGTKRSIANWFNSRDSDDLAYQVVKYQQRDGWSARDLLRLAHPRPRTETHDVIYRWITGDVIGDGLLPEVIEAFEGVKRIPDVRFVCELIHKANLPRECIPTQLLNNPEVWAALNERMPITATIRNLATMTRVGLLSTGSTYTQKVCERLANEDNLRKGRVHPIQILSALLTYKQGHGERGNNTWSPVSSIVDALDSAFYLSFKSINPTGKSHVLALDVSGSMHSGSCAGVPNLTPAVGATAMAMITHAVEKSVTVCGFGGHYQNLDISSRRRLDDNVASIRGMNFGTTDCSLPMLHAAKAKAMVDVFVVYTDNETYHGNCHPHVALKIYEQTMGRPAKLVVVGMVANQFTIAKPDASNMLDVVGFDSNAPSVIADFVRS